MRERRISDLARDAGVTPRTIRYYERIGLLPEPRRTDAGYRIYGPDADERLRFIARAKRLDLSLDEIRDLLTYWREGDCLRTREHLQHLLLDKLERLREAVRELERFEGQLEEAYGRLTGRAPGDACGPACGCPPEVRAHGNAPPPRRAGPAPS